MATYTLISSVTVGSGGAANIEFTSIPATYTDLNLFYSLRSSSNVGGSAAYDYAYLELNSNQSNLSYRQLFTENSSTVVSNNESAVLYPWASGNTATASTFSNGYIYIPNYASSNEKSISIDMAGENNSSTQNFLVFNAGKWANTSAITSLKLIAKASNTFAQHSTAYLYGISNA